MKVKNTVVWFDIPVKDIDRAIKFYSKVLGVSIDLMEGAPTKYAVFPFDSEAVSGGLKEDKDMVSDKGPLIYLNAGDDLSSPLALVENAGGKVLQNKYSIGGNGFMAVILDTEGNRVALWSPK